ncbi:MAG: hypothetical protein V3U65_12620 [Granulosicoccaceae bacterium]
MSMPKLKRINVHSEQELDVWLAKNSGQEKNILVVTHANASHRKYVSRDQVGQVLAKHGWKAGPRYTLGSVLLGHEIKKLGT